MEIEGISFIANETASYAIELSEEFKLGGGNTETGHLLLSLARSPYLRAELRRFAILPHHVERFLDGRFLDSGSDHQALDPFTPLASRVLDRSRAIAEQLSTPLADVEHLMLALIEETDGSAHKIMRYMAIDLENLYNELQLRARGWSRQIGAHVSSDPLPVKMTAKDVFDDYQEFTRTTAVYPDAGDGSFNSLSYCILGLTGEAGEVAEKVKKRFRKGGAKAFERERGNILPLVTTLEDFTEELTKELGDVMWYLARIADELQVPLSEIVKRNKDKLVSRKARGVLKGEGDNR